MQNQRVTISPDKSGADLWTELSMPEEKPSGASDNSQDLPMSPSAASGMRPRRSSHQDAAVGENEVHVGQLSLWPGKEICERADRIPHDPRNDVGFGRPAE
jgi:hypothetical protein